MQNTTFLYRQLLADGTHWFETRVVIGDGEPENGYDESVLFSVETNSQIMEETLEIGKCISQEVEVKMLNPPVKIPRMGRIAPYVRVRTASAYSEWIPQGVFFIDTREITQNDDGMDVLTLHGYDAMLKANQNYTDSDLDWPATDIDIVEEIASQMGVGVDSRMEEIMNEAYQISEPGTSTLIEMLSHIAVMYLGNFIITEAGDLRLVTLMEMPIDTRYLIDHVGNSITFGGDRILV